MVNWKINTCLLLVYTIIISQVQSQGTEDYNTLKVLPKNDNWTLCFDNPLLNLDSKKYGIYDFWLRMGYNDDWK